MSEGFDFEAWVERQLWTFAKTMPENPHEYVVRPMGQGGDRSWYSAMDFIGAHGTRQDWHGRKVTYLVVAEHKYWVTWPVINRQRIEADR
jgi:hypothetical protein